MKRIALLRLTLANGEHCLRQVVEIDDNGLVARHYTLTEEMPFTEWWPHAGHIGGNNKLVLDKNR